jgi:nitroreductase
MRTPEGRAGSRPPYEEMVAFATRAPSVHNTQPWLWRVSATGLELLADWSRQLSHADPDGRDLLISCGAALHHVQVAAAALGWAADVHHCPNPEYPRLLAAVTFTPREPSLDTARQLTHLMDRQTDRRQFGAWPVPDQDLETLARTGRDWGVTVTPVRDDAIRTRLLRLTVAADTLQRKDAAYAAEIATWARDRERDGVPTTNVPSSSPEPTAEALLPQRFPSGSLVDDSDVNNARMPDLLLIATSSDDVLSAVRAGEALSAIWLNATGLGLVGVPLSQATEVEETRLELETHELRDRACPQILFCVGWPTPDRTPLPTTPRRPITDVLVRDD